MIELDRQRCTGCGACAVVCHNRCVVICDGTARIDTVLCDRCVQCVAVCPQRALSWAGVPPIPADERRLPTAGQLDELFKQRHSIRFFKADRIDRSLLQEIVSCGVYAPTNNHDLRVVVVDDREAIEALEGIAVRFNARIYRLFFRSGLVFGVLRRFVPDVNAKVRAKLETRRHDRLNPAAMVFVVGDPRIALSEASAQAALDVMTFYAQMQGIGSCLWGAGTMILNRNRKVRRKLGLRGPERILGILLLGYPSIKFGNNVVGRAMPVVWNGDWPAADRPTPGDCSPAYVQLGVFKLERPAHESMTGAIHGA
ncbi:MAG: nitroreductase family protein [Anaerolineae bacterium]|jgi:nitroreductase